MIQVAVLRQEFVANNVIASYLPARSQMAIPLLVPELQRKIKTEKIIIKGKVDELKNSHIIMNILPIQE